MGDARQLVEALRGGELAAGFEGGEGRLGSLGACVHYSFRHLAAADQERLAALTIFEGVADIDVLAIFSGIEGVPARFAGLDTEAWQATLDAGVATGLLTGLGGAMFRIHPAMPHFLMGWWRQLAGDRFAEEQEATRLASIRAHAALGGWLGQQIGGGSAETAFAVLAAERRSLGRAAAEALTHGLFTEAQEILRPLGALWNSLGLFEEARGWVDRCREATEDRDGRAPAWETPEGGLWLVMVWSQANRLKDAGHLDAAEATYNAIRRQLEGSESEPGRRYLAGAYHELGWVAQDRWDLSSAEAWYRKSLEILEALGDRSHIATSYHHRGMVAQDRGDLSSAEDWYRKSLEIEEALGNRPHMAQSYHQLGIVAQACGNLSAAEGWYRKSLEIKEALRNRPGMALTYGQLGLLSEAKGNRNAALDWMIRSVALFPQFPHPATGPVSSHLARLASQLGIETLAASWQRVTGNPLPEAVRRFVEEAAESADEPASGGPGSE